MIVYFYVSVELWDWERSKAPPPMVPPFLGNPPKPDLATISAVEYGFNVGIRRLIDIWKDNKVSVTASVSALAAQSYPETVRSLAAEGHEIAAHGYHQGTLLPLMDRDKQAEAIHASIEILERTTGQRPMGWVGPGARADEDTVEILASEGFLYCCEFQDDEFPYHVEVNGKTLVVLPFRFDGNPTDLRVFNPNALTGPTQAVVYLRDVFDAYYKAAASTPLLFYYGVHPFVSGRPDRAEALNAFLSYVKNLPDVWITTRRGIAEWYRANFLASAERNSN
jgi:allantoinase